MEHLEEFVCLTRDELFSFYVDYYKSKMVVDSSQAGNVGVTAESDAKCVNMENGACISV